MPVISFHWHLYTGSRALSTPWVWARMIQFSGWRIPKSKSFVGLHFLLKLDHCAVRNLEIFWTVENQGGMLLYK